MDSSLQSPVNGAFREGWQIFRHELLYFFWALMEVALVAPVFLALTPWTTFWPPGMTTAWLLLIMLIPFNVNRLTSFFQVSVERQQVIMAISLLLLLVLSWRILLYSPAGVADLDWLTTIFKHLGDGQDPRWSRELALFVVIAFMWWRGIAMAGRGVDYRDIGLRMRSGILIAFFVVAGLAGALMQRPVTPFVLLFIFASLVSVVLTRVQQLELERSGRLFPVDPGWLLTILAAAAGVSIVTGAISGIISGDSLGAILGFFDPLWTALQFILIVLVTLLSVVLSPLLALLIQLLQLLASEFGDSAVEGLDTLQQSLGSFPQVASESVVESTQSTGHDYRQLFAGLILLFVILLVALTLGHLYRMVRPGAVPQRQSVNPFDNVDVPKISGLGQRLLQRFNLLRRWRTVASIRQTYRAMCAAAAEKGYPRLENQTSYEYLPSLYECWPELQADARLITEAYNRAHYGELPETEAELADIMAAWQRLGSAEDRRRPNDQAV